MFVKEPFGLLDGEPPPADSALLPDSAPARPPKRPAPFSIRLSPEERARLVAEAAGAPVGAYIKAKVLGGTAPAPVRRNRVAAPLADRQALGQVLALLGNARLSSNLNQLAHAAHLGILPVGPEVEAALTAALDDIRTMRRLLLAALGLKPEDRS